MSADADDSDLGALREDFERALVDGNAALAELVALDAVAAGVPVGDLYVDVLGPALNEVGSRWRRGEMSVADEHLATAIVLGIMRLVGRAAARRPRRSRGRVLLAGLGTEGHVVGLRMVADLAEGAGFDVRYLGAAVPVETLGAIVAKHQPDAVGLSVTMAAPAAAVEAAIEEILAVARPRVLLLGGAGVPEQARHDPRVCVPPDAREAVVLLETLKDPETG